MEEEKSNHIPADQNFLVDAHNELAQWMHSLNSNSEFIVSHSHYGREISGPGVNSNIDFTGRSKFGVNQYDFNIIKQKISVCRSAYENAGIIANAIDLMVDFALEGITIVHENKSIQNFCIQWAKRVNLLSIIEQLLKAYFIDSNVPVLEFRGKISDDEVSRFKKAVAGSLNSTEAARIFNTPEKKIKRIVPYKYAILDVLNLRAEGSNLFGTLNYEYQLYNEDNLSKIDDSNEKVLLLKKAIGEKDFNHLKQTGLLRIDPQRISLLFYKKDGYRTWANPFLWRTIQHLKFKEALTQMDMSVIESVKNVLTIVKLGRTDLGIPATKEMIAKFSSLLKTPTKSPTIVWHDLISIESNYPPVDKILGEEKYEQVNKEIRAAIGIPEVILVGAGKGSFSNSFLSVKGLIQRLKGARETTSAWIEKQFQILSKAMDFKRPPFVKMEHIDLEDEGEQKRLLLELVDRGMISYQTCIEAFGENYDIEVQRMKQEDKFRQKNSKRYPYTLFKTGKYLPFDTSTDSLIDSETVDKNQKQVPTAQGPKGDQGGRPSGTKKTQKQQTTPRTKPKGQSVANWLDIDPIDKKFLRNLNILSKIQKSINSKGIVYENSSEDEKMKLATLFSLSLKDLSKYKKINSKTLNSLIDKNFESLSSEDVCTENDNEIVVRVRKLIGDFIQENGIFPEKNEMRDIIACAHILN